jgi:galacturan 1,4-alpha-galacturonidase
MSYEGRATSTFLMVVFLALSSSYMAEAFRRGLVATKPSAPTPASAAADPPAAANAPTASPGGGAATVFDITKYGATQNSKDNFGAFQKTWIAACASNRSVTVVIPKGTFTTGQVFFQGPCNATSITVEVQGTLKALTDISEFPSPEWFSIQHVNNVHLKGTGTFDGQGTSIWKSNDCATNDNCVHPPVNMKVLGVNNSLIEDVTSLNAKGFHFHVSNSNNVTLRHLTITAPGDSPNTDGIHVSSSSLVTITNSVIGTGDDCVSVGQGVLNLTVTDVTCGPGHGISVGSLGKYDNELDVDGVFVRNCTIRNTTNGARIKTWGGSGPSKASNIIYEDIVMENVQNPIIIDQHYGSQTKPSNVKVSNVHFSKIRGTSASVLAVNLMCSTAASCEGVELADVELKYSGEPAKSALFASECQNAKIKVGGKMNPPACKV